MGNCLTRLRRTIQDPGSPLLLSTRATLFDRQAERRLNTVPVRRYASITSGVLLRQKSSISGWRTQGILSRLFFCWSCCAHAQKRAGILPESFAVLPVILPPAFRIIIKREKFADLIFMNKRAFFRGETIVCVRAYARSPEEACATDSQVVRHVRPCGSHPGFRNMIAYGREYI